MNKDKQIAKDEFKKNIIELFEIEKLPEEKQAETISQIGNIILQSVLIRVLPALNEEEASEYDKMIEKNVEPDVLLDFFFEKIPNFLEIITEETENFRKNSAEFLEQIK